MTYRHRRSKHTPAAKGGSWIRPGTRWAIYKRDSFRCVYCASGSALTLDHVHAVEHAGRNNQPCNLVTCCLSCNSSKQGLSKRAWYARLRARGINTERVRKRIARLIRKPIDRLAGRLIANVVRVAKTIEPRLSPTHHARQFLAMQVGG